MNKMIKIIMVGALFIAPLMQSMDGITRFGNLTWHSIRSCADVLTHKAQEMPRAAGNLLAAHKGKFIAAAVVGAGVAAVYIAKKAYPDRYAQFKDKLVGLSQSVHGYWDRLSNWFGGFLGRARTSGNNVNQGAPVGGGALNTTGNQSSSNANQSITTPAPGITGSPVTTSTSESSTSTVVSQSSSSGTQVISAPTTTTSVDTSTMTITPSLSSTATGSTSTTITSPSAGAGIENSQEQQNASESDEGFVTADEDIEQARQARNDALLKVHKAFLFFFDACQNAHGNNTNNNWLKYHSRLLECLNSVEFRTHVPRKAQVEYNQAYDQYSAYAQQCLHSSISEDTECREYATMLDNVSQIIQKYAR